MAIKGRRERHPASRALIELREAFGLSQGEFAAQVMNRAVITIARYETSHPPVGDVLLELADIAKKQSIDAKHANSAKEFENLHAAFLKCYEDDAIAKLSAAGYAGNLVVMVPPAARQAGEWFRTLIDALESPHRTRREAGKKGLSVLRQAAKECQ